MRHLTRLLTPLTRAVTDPPPAFPEIPTAASGFLTIGNTTYINPAGTYPLFHTPDGSPTPVNNDTDRPLTILTERDHSPPPPDLLLAPGERTDTRRGDWVHVG
ncbi:hypothetical protein ADL22_06870 [Streptomyces sp. NRRL F-4489]|uniref:hypothetical protein n=1 Tax=Streptomyces sp. NRRL F-4489 TaxID=1609095 RepID=UPI00074AC080|nr:hypothetical protein [Streptomyces sp. NRRL F-4489]KUL51006.1 hypothetical protein ADL22_06870 [Streptomyces sp. NRRL F-4489]